MWLSLCRCSCNRSVTWAEETYRLQRKANKADHIHCALGSVCSLSLLFVPKQYIQKRKRRTTNLGRIPGKCRIRCMTWKRVITSKSLVESRQNKYTWSSFDHSCLLTTWMIFIHCNACYNCSNIDLHQDNFAICYMVPRTMLHFSITSQQPLKIAMIDFIHLNFFLENETEGSTSLAPCRWGGNTGLGSESWFLGCCSKVF